MTLAEIFSKDFLFAPTITDENKFFLTFLILFSAMIAAGIIFQFIKWIDKEPRVKQSSMFITVGAMGLLYDLAREVRLPWLGSRLFISLTFLTFFIWVIYLTIWMIKYIPKTNLKEKSKEKYDKYLPKPKKKK